MKKIKIPARPNRWRDHEDPIPERDPSARRPLRPGDGDPVPPPLDDADISLDYDPVAVCACLVSEVLEANLGPDDEVTINHGDDESTVSAGRFTITITQRVPLSSTAARIANAIHALLEALQHAQNGEE